MRHIPFLFAIFFLLASAVSLTLNAQETAVTKQSETKSLIQSVLQKQVDCWNRNDIDGFMETYWKSEALTFSSGGKTTRGWQATIDRYKKSYPSGKMGKLHFDNLEVTVLSPQSALVLGQWHLAMENEKKDGNFSLVLKKFDNRWLIIHDHSSIIRDE